MDQKKRTEAHYFRNIKNRKLQMTEQLAESLYKNVEGEEREESVDKMEKVINKSEE